MIDQHAWMVPVQVFENLREKFLKPATDTSATCVGFEADFTNPVGNDSEALGGLHVHEAGKVKHFRLHAKYRAVSRSEGNGEDVHLPL